MGVINHAHTILFASVFIPVVYLSAVAAQRLLGNNNINPDLLAEWILSNLLMAYLQQTNIYHRKLLYDTR